MNKTVFLIIVFGFFTLAWAQLPLQVEFPAGSSLQLSNKNIIFNLEKNGFPPRELPAYYYPVEPAEGLELRLFSNLEGSWTLSAGLEPLLGDNEKWLLPERIEVRMDGGPWLPLSSSVVLLAGSGPTGGYQIHTVEFRLRIEGDELPGSYQGVLIFSLSRL